MNWLLQHQLFFPDLNTVPIQGIVKSGHSTRTLDINHDKLLTLIACTLQSNIQFSSMLSLVPLASQVTSLLALAMK